MDSDFVDLFPVISSDKKEVEEEAEKKKGDKQGKKDKKDKKKKGEGDGPDEVPLAQFPLGF